MVRLFLGIEIHPAAQIGHSCFIDHGSGIVIGETAIVGHHCILFHGVTLGGTGKHSGKKRHPTVGNHVFLGAGCKILGNITIGDRCKVGAGSVVVKDVPENCTVIGVPGRCFKNQESPSKEEEQQQRTLEGSEERKNPDIFMPDMDAQAIRALYKRELKLEDEIQMLRNRLTALEKSVDVDTSGTTSLLNNLLLRTAQMQDKDEAGLQYFMKQEEQKLLDGAGI
jgi:serine O-acetyltransferase